MKIKKFFALLTMLSLFSCAKDDPFTMGIMECKVEVSNILPTSAEIRVTFSEENDNILGRAWNHHPNINLSDKPLESPDYFWDEVDFYFSEAYICEEEGTDATGLFYDFTHHNNYVFTFMVFDLKPNKKYYVLLNTDINLSGKGYEESGLYYTGCSFTTADNKDYTSLVTNCVLLKNAENKVSINLDLISGFRLYDISSCEASVSSSMDDPITITDTNIYENGNNTYTLNINTPNLESGKYYIQFYGKIWGDNIDDITYVLVKIFVDIDVNKVNILKITKL